MAEKRILFDVNVSMQGVTEGKPLQPSLRGSFLLLATTGTTQSAALSTLSGSTASSQCYSIPISSSESLILSASTSPVYVACAAVRPGSSLYFSTGQCKQFYSDVSQTFSLTCVIPGGGAYMTLKYATGITAATSSYYFKNYQILSGTTYQNQKIARMSEVSSYFNFCTGATSLIIPQAQLGTRYAAINNTYYKPMYTYPWHNGDIDYYTLEGFTVTCVSSMRLTLNNNLYYDEEFVVTLQANDIYGEVSHLLFNHYLDVPLQSESYVFITPQNIPPDAEGEISSITLTVETMEGASRNFSAMIMTAGMGAIYTNGQTGTPKTEDLSNNIEIQSVYVEVSN